MFDVAGKGKYFIDFKNGSGSVGEGDPGSKPDVTISMNEEVFLKIFNRKCRFFLRKITINDYDKKHLNLSEQLFLEVPCHSSNEGQGNMYFILSYYYEVTNFL